jgi:integrase
MYSLLEGFYSNKETTGGLQLCGRCLKEYQAEIANTFIPYLKQARITDFGQITATNLHNYQDSLLAGGMKPQTVNNKMKAVKRVFAYLAWKGIIQDNPAERVRGLPVHHTDRDARGCYDLDRLKGVFNKRWKDQTSYLLALLIYTTGMRNGEIRRLRMEDILQVGGCRFASVRESKTASGVRLIPLHDFVYRKLCTRHAPQGAPLFDFRRMEPFNTANAELARQLGVGPEELERENITFYSGRHYWKTLMNSEGLGEDIEEIFMGHKVSGSVARLYNHRDKQGKKRMIKKARQVFSILDRCVFNTKRRGPAPAAAGVRGSSPRHVQ